MQPLHVRKIPHPCWNEPYQQEDRVAQQVPPPPKILGAKPQLISEAGVTPITIPSVTIRLSDPLLFSSIKWHCKLLSITLLIKETARKYSPRTL